MFRISEISSESSPVQPDIARRRHRRRPASRVGLAALAVWAITSSGCIFGKGALVTGLFSEEEGVASVSVSMNASWAPCAMSVDGSFGCTFGFDETASLFGLSDVELLLLLFLADPMVVQLPDTVLGVNGSFSHPAPASGALQVEGPLASIPIDRTRSLHAEPGTALWVLSLPEAVYQDVATFDGPVGNAEPADPVGFNLQVRLPSGPGSVPAKIVTTAYARTVDGDEYYPPIFPCVDSMVDVPTVSLPIPAPGSSAELDLSAAANVQGCSGQVFDVGRGASLIEVPVVGRFGLFLLAMLIAGCGWWRVGRV